MTRSGSEAGSSGDAKNAPHGRAARPRTIDVGEADIDENAAEVSRKRGSATSDAQAPDRQGAGPATLEGDQAVAIADTVFAADDVADGAGDADAWRAQPGRAIRFTRWLAGLGVGLIATGLLGAVVSAAATRFLDGDGVWTGAALAGLALLILVVLGMTARDLLALSRLGSVTALRRQAHAARLETGGAAADRAAERVAADVLALYNRRVDMEWPIAAFRDDRVSASGGPALIDALDDRVLAPLDRRARRVAAETARRAAVFTAVSPFAMLDMLATVSLTARAANRIAVIYGVRPGRVGSLTLVRRAFFTVMAAGAIDAADDLAGDLLGSGLATRLSRRAGVGVLNGLLAARLALAIADEVRPLPWRPGRRPSPRAIVREIFIQSRS